METRAEQKMEYETKTQITLRPACPHVNSAMMGPGQQVQMPGRMLEVGIFSKHVGHVGNMVQRVIALDDAVVAADAWLAGEASSAGYSSRPGHSSRF